MSEKEEQQKRDLSMVAPAEASNPQNVADAALFMLDMLLSHAPELLSSASPAFLEQARIRRLRNAWKAMEQALVPLYVTDKDNKMIPVVCYESEDEIIHRLLRVPSVKRKRRRYSHDAT